MDAFAAIERRVDNEELKLEDGLDAVIEFLERLDFTSRVCCPALALLPAKERRLPALIGHARKLYHFSL